jgi:hypothetical protein
MFEASRPSPFLQIRGCQIRGGTWPEIGISNTVGFDLAQAAIAAFLMALCQ